MGDGAVDVMYSPVRSHGLGFAGDDVCAALGHRFRKVF
jgi:hypothetical protein